MKRLIILPLLCLATAFAHANTNPADAPADSAKADTTKKITKPRKPWGSTRSNGTDVHLGLNQFVNNGTTTTFPAEAYDLRPWGSRFVEIEFKRESPISYNEAVAVRLRTGLSFSFYNFMFEGNNVATKTATGVTFPNYKEDLSKTKLSASYLNVPLALNVKFRKGAISNIAVGGYGGVRLGTHTKIKTQDGGRKEHEKNDMYLSNFRYGVKAEVGFRNFFDFFVNYDLNPVFRDSKGPNVSAISFGIIL